uniref:Uncharacterized protein n=1 Tax=Schistocephalus solidus TaxID=70667 RepID=A0A0X3NML7_SCHSO
MASNHLSVVLCVGIMLTIMGLLSTSAAYMLSSGYQSDQNSMVYKMPRRHSTKLRVFAECRKDCNSQCNHSLYAYLANKKECFTCLFECMSVFTEQAEKMGIQVLSEKSSKRARHAAEFGDAARKRLRLRQTQTNPPTFDLQDYRRSP